ncbi:MAG: phosphoribosylamine--glycine ligase [Candidatus Limnocylindrales bacterium]
MSLREHAGVAVPGTILIVGGGGREHALAWRLARDPGVAHVVVAPGNPGMTADALLAPDVLASDGLAVVALALAIEADLVVIGPEAPLVAGLADRLRAAGVAAFGPSAAAARIEASKAFCREVAHAAGVQIADGAAFTDAIAAVLYAQGLDGPVVVKADGLAAGKGVVMCGTLDDARRAIRAVLIERAFGAAGDRVVVERALEGQEVSVIAICDATTALALPAARDHKRIGEGDVGPNTGGMGAISPPADLPDTALATLVRTFHRPVLAELAERGSPFRGALFAGLMLTARGPRLLEFNARFGDPETQAILPRLGVPLAPLLLAAAEDRLAEVAAGLGIVDGCVPAVERATAAVVLAAPGYPEAPVTGAPIRGLDAGAVRSPDVLVFHAGVADDGAGGLVTAGGRVMAVVGLGPDVPGAAAVAQTAASEVTFPGIQWRRDIGTAPAADGTSVGASEETRLVPAGAAPAGTAR